jgi:hypothetical protein
MFLDPFFEEVNANSIEKPVLDSSHVTQIVSSITMGGAAMAVLFISKFKMKSIFVGGHFFQCILLCLLGHLIQKGD